MGWSTRAGAREREHPSAAHRALPAEPGSGADGPHDRLFSHADVGGVWPAANRERSAFKPINRLRHTSRVEVEGVHIAWG
jgi:hypothetical protein